MTSQYAAVSVITASALSTTANSTNSNITPDHSTSNNNNNNSSPSGRETTLATATARRTSATATAVKGRNFQRAEDAAYLAALLHQYHLTWLDPDDHDEVKLRRLIRRYQELTDGKLPPPPSDHLLEISLRARSGGAAGQGQQEPAEPGQDPYQLHMAQVVLRAEKVFSEGEDEAEASSYSHQQQQQQQQEEENDHPAHLRRSHHRRTRDTGYDYRSSQYGQVAHSWVQERVSAGHTFAMQRKCESVLALLVAWCCHQVFRGTSNREGRYCTLGLDRIGRELALTNKTVRYCLKALQEARLITITFPDLALGKEGHVLFSYSDLEQLKQDYENLAPHEGGGPRGYLNPRCIQLGYKTSEAQAKANAIYFLGSGLGLGGHGQPQVELLSPFLALPAFNPFSGSASAKATAHSNQEKDVSSTTTTTTTTTTTSDSNRTSRIGLEKDVVGEERTSQTRPIGLEKDVVGRNSLKKDYEGDLLRLNKSFSSPHGNGNELINGMDEGLHDSLNSNPKNPETPTEAPQEEDYLLPLLPAAAAAPAPPKRFKDLDPEQLKAFSLLMLCHERFTIANAKKPRPCVLRVAFDLAVHPLEQVEQAIEYVEYQCRYASGKDRPFNPVGMVVDLLKRGQEYVITPGEMDLLRLIEAQTRDELAQARLERHSQLGLVPEPPPPSPLHSHPRLAQHEQEEETAPWYEEAATAGAGSLSAQVYSQAYNHHSQAPMSSPQTLASAGVGGANKTKTEAEYDTVAVVVGWRGRGGQAAGEVEPPTATTGVIPPSPKPPGHLELTTSVASATDQPLSGCAAIVNECLAAGMSRERLLAIAREAQYQLPTYKASHFWQLVKLELTGAEIPPQES